MGPTIIACMWRNSRADRSLPQFVAKAVWLAHCCARKALCRCVSAILCGSFWIVVWWYIIAWDHRKSAILYYSSNCGETQTPFCMPLWNWNYCPLLHSYACCGLRSIDGHQGIQKCIHSPEFSIYSLSALSTLLMRTILSPDSSTKQASAFSLLSTSYASIFSWRCTVVDHAWWTSTTGKSMLSLRVNVQQKSIRGDGTESTHWWSYAKNL